MDRRTGAATQGKNEKRPVTFGPIRRVFLPDGAFRLALQGKYDILISAGRAAGAARPLTETKEYVMITVSDLSLAYSGQNLFSHVDLQFTKGNCYGIIGANGAGKSTFLKILSGQLEPSTGSVYIDPKACLLYTSRH